MLLLALLALGAPAAAQEKDDSPPASKAEPVATRQIDFEELVTNDGEIYQQVRVRSAEPDSLLIEHSNGLARVSLFDLSRQVQQQYEFDSDAAIEHYKKREEEQRALRKQLFLERIRHEAAEEAELRQEMLERTAKAQWIPVRAKIVSFRDDNALAIVDRIVLVPTRTKNVFGGDGLPGPPIKKYARLSKSAVLLKGVTERHQQSEPPGKYWTGYIWPDGEVSLDAERPEDTTPAYRAVQAGN